MTAEEGCSEREEGGKGRKRERQRGTIKGKEEGR